MITVNQMQPVPVLTLPGIHIEGEMVHSPLFSGMNKPQAMYKIEFLPHTADIRMKIEADSQKEIFRGSVAGMNQVIRKDFCEEQRGMGITNEIIVRAPDMTSLLIDFLNEVLSLSHINKLIYCRVEVRRLTPTELTAMIEGFHTNNWEEDIKAVTYHEAELSQYRGRWTARIIFDI